MRPIWDRQDPGGPHVGPMKFAIWVVTAQRRPYNTLFSRTVKLVRSIQAHNGGIKWQRFLHHWPFVRGIHHRIPLYKGVVMQSFDVFVVVSQRVCVCAYLCMHISHKFSTANMYIARTRGGPIPTVASSGLNVRSSQGRAIEFKFLTWYLMVLLVCEWHSVYWMILISL